MTEASALSRKSSSPRQRSRRQEFGGAAALLLLIFLFVVMFANSCTGAQIGSAETAMPIGPLEVMHRSARQHATADITITKPVTDPREAADLEVETIALERSSCYGTCPQYTFVIRSNGTATYCGRKHADKSGVFQGHVPLTLFSAMSNAVVDIGLLEMAETNLTLSTDLPSAFVYVQTKNGSRVLQSYGGAGPARLWLLEETLDSLALSISWHRESARIDCDNLLEAKIP